MKILKDKEFMACVIIVGFMVVGIIAALGGLKHG